MTPPLEDGRHRVRLGHAFLGGPRQVDGHDRDRAACSSGKPYLQHGEVAPPSPGDRVVVHRHHRQPGEDRVPVLASLVGSMGPVVSGHVEELGQHGGLVDAPGPLRVPVYFLEGDDVGVQGAQDVGEALQVDLPVHPLAVADVEGDDADGRLGVGVGREG